MNDKQKKRFKKTVWIMGSFLLLEGMVLTALVALTIFSQYKLDLTTELLLEQLQATVTNLGGFLQQNWEERNPFFIMGTIASILYALYVNSGISSKKEGWDTEDKNAYHGSARWAKPQEIFDQQNFLKQSKQNVQSDFEHSLTRRESE